MDNVYNACKKLNVEENIELSPLLSSTGFMLETSSNNDLHFYQPDAVYNCGADHIANSTGNFIHDFSL